ncbi:MAG TPA: HAMP domain-containing sensor histidine kinase [Solirubrobacteraceae bacterium]|nr:HAMP domain-containing sensor histidine kinase [Solirubrobacteraceae bacterium]
MRPRAVLGLRPRLVAALVLTGAVTIGVAALAVLGPLERKLNREELTTLTSDATGISGSFNDLTKRDLQQRPSPQPRFSPKLLRLVRQLRRRTQARVVIVDMSLKPVVNFDPDVRDSFDDARTALRTRHVVSSFANTSGTHEARVAVPVHTDSGWIVVLMRKSLAAERAAVNTVRNAFLTAALVGVAVALALGIGLATGLLRRLQRLRETALRIAERGPAVEVQADPARDEVGDLTRAFVTMQERLRHQEEARRTFVATASHELRTPLTSLQGMLELIEEGLQQEPPDRRDALEQVERARGQTQRLGRLAADLLDLSRLDADIEMRTEAVELSELCRASLAEFEVRVRERHQALRFDGSPDPCWAFADPNGVARIVRILVDNALRFSPPDAPVVVVVGNEESEPTVTVTDSGPGVPIEEHELIFERFKRGRSTGGESGFGLGLAIGRELARRMGGTLELRHAGPGASFVLRLPRAPADQTGAE